MSTCRSCGAEIVWAEYEVTGKKAPFDKTPTVGGNAILYPGDPPTAKVIGQVEGIPLYISHFATCPQAKEHRKTSEPQTRLDVDPSGSA